MQKFILLMIFLSFAAIAVGQTTIWNLDFESAGGYTPSTSEFSDGGTDYFATIKMNGDEDAYDYDHNFIADVDNISLNSLQGNYFFSGMDIDGEGASLPVNIKKNDIDINGYTSLNFSVYLAEDDPNENIWEDDDYVHILYRLDDGSWKNLILIEANNNGKAAIDTDDDGTGDGTTITDSFTEFSESITGTGSQIDIKVEFKLDSGDEDIALDNLEISGESIVDNPGSFTASTISRSQIDLSFSTNSANDNVIIVYDNDGTFSYPSGSPPSTGQAFAGGTLLYNGTVSPVNHTELSPNHTVYYSAWSYDGSDYSPGVEDNATTLPFLVITEIMQNPDAVGDSDGEWFEIYNAGSSTIDINGYKIKDGGSDNHTINNSGSLNISSDSYLVLGTNVNTSTNGNVTVDYEYSGISLTNSDDEIILTMADDTEIDRVEYTGSSPWPDPTGASMTLNMNELTNNNIGSNWYEATSSYGDGDLGTPGALNDFKTTTWNGGTSSNWNDAANWSEGSVPSNAYDVTIPAGKKSVEIATDQTAECNDLTIDGSLTIKSSSTSTGSLIINGTATGNISMERYVTGYGTGSNEWHLISSPVQNQTIQGDFVPSTPDADEDLYMWDESQNLWINHKDGADTWNTNFDDPFKEGKGYLYANKADVTKTFTGTPNNNDFITGTGDMPSLTYNSSQGDGWNLLGNPFTSGIDWDKLTKSDGVNGAVYVRDGSYGQYISWNGSVGALTDGIIPPNNGFFVKVNSGSETISIDKGDISSGGDQVHSNDFHKSSDAAENLVVLKISGNGYEDKTYVHLNNSATKQFDRDFDAYKLFGVEEAPQLYSITEDDKILSINEIPLSLSAQVVNLGLKVGEEAGYKISASVIQGIQNVLLEDSFTEEMINLKKRDYEFTTAPNDSEDRFRLHLEKSAIGIPEDSELQNTHIYANNHNIYIQTSENLTDGTVFVYNTLGQLVVQKDLNNDYRVIGMESKGAYIVKVSAEEGTVTEKVIIH